MLFLAVTKEDADVDDSHGIDVDVETKPVFEGDISWRGKQKNS